MKKSLTMFWRYKNVISKHTYLIDFNIFYFLVAGDANTLSPMESNQHVIKNNDNNTKADLMTMSTPPHLLSTALSTSEDGQPLPPKRYYNHRSKYILFSKYNVYTKVC